MELDYQFSAVSYDRLFEKGFESDVILLAPQIGYLYNKAREILRNKKVILIPPKIFGTYDAFGVIDLIKTEWNSNKKFLVSKTSLNALQNQTGVQLVICSISEFLRVRIVYRIYEPGIVRENKTIIKGHFRLRDLEDICDVVLAKNKDIESIVV